MRYNKNPVFAGKLSESSGAGLFGDVASTVGEAFIRKGVPYLAKKRVEAGRYYASEALRNPATPKRVINYGLKKARPAVEKIGSELINQLSTKVRPNKRHKTDRPDLI